MVLAELPAPVPDRLTGRIPSALEFFQRNQHLGRWNEPSTPDQVRRTQALIENGLAEGGIGIGVLLGYAPESGRDEYFQLAQLAAAADVPVFTHARRMSNVEPGSSLDGALEIIGAAAGSGAHMHICHINSTSLRRIHEISTPSVCRLARNCTGAHGRNAVASGVTFSATALASSWLRPWPTTRNGIARSSRSSPLAIGTSLESSSTNGAPAGNADAIAGSEPAWPRNSRDRR